MTNNNNTRNEGNQTMNNATLEGFRKLADQMGCNGTWQWIGPHMSQRMFGITKERAENYAARYGGEAKPEEK